MEHILFLNFLKPGNFNRTFVDGLNDDRTERLITRARQRLAVGQTDEQIAKAWKDLPTSEVFLAVQAAKILESRDPCRTCGRPTTRLGGYCSRAHEKEGNLTRRVTIAI